MRPVSAAAAPPQNRVLYYLYALHDPPCQAPFAGFLLFPAPVPVSAPLVTHAPGLEYFVAVSSILHQAVPGPGIELGIPYTPALQEPLEFPNLPGMNSQVQRRATVHTFRSQGTTAFSLKRPEAPPTPEPDKLRRLPHTEKPLDNLAAGGFKAIRHHHRGSQLEAKKRPHGSPHGLL